MTRSKMDTGFWQGGRMALFFGLLLGLVVVSCTDTGTSRSGALQRGGDKGGKAGDPSNPQGGGADAGSTGSREALAGRSDAELLLLKTERSNQDASEEDELYVLQHINYELCRKRNTLAQSCAVRQPIVNPSTQQVFDCKVVSEPAAPAAPAAPQVISITIPDNKVGSFKLRLNDIWESSPFGAGKTTITFTGTGTGNLTPPLFMDVYKLVLVSAREDQPTLPDLAGFTVSIAVNDNFVMESAPLVPSLNAANAAARNEAWVDLRDLQSKTNSSLCSLSPETLNATLQNIDQTVRQGRANSALKDYHKEKQNNASVDRDAAIEDILKLQSSISRRLGVLTEQRQRRSQLLASLTADANRGCQFAQHITKFEVIMKGERSDQEIGRHDTPAVSPHGEGLASELVLDFGSISVTVDTASDNILGGSVFSNVTLNPTDIVGGLDHLTIRKKRVHLDSTRDCTSTIKVNFSGGLDTENCTYDWREYDTMSISEIMIKLNDKTAYHERDLQIKLNRDNLTWTREKPEFRKNPSWVLLMQDHDCNVAK